MRKALPSWWHALAAALEPEAKRSDWWQPWAKAAAAELKGVESERRRACQSELVSNPSRR